MLAQLLMQLQVQQLLLVLLLLLLLLLLRPLLLLLRRRLLLLLVSSMPPVESLMLWLQFRLTSSLRLEVPTWLPKSTR